MEIFKNEQFGEVRTILEGEKILFCAADVAKALGYANPNKAVNDHCRAITKRSTPISGKVQSINFIPEGDVYRLIIRSKLPAAERFERWLFDDVIPSIRKHGGYIANDDLFVETYFGNMSEEQKQICRMSFAAIREKDQIIEKQKLELVEKDKVIEHKEDVIVGLVGDIDLATKRQRINQIVRYRTRDKVVLSQRWNLLYTEFEKKYHVNLSVRLENYMDAYKPKLKNKIDVIERQMKMIPQLYEVCCKLFENDVKILMEEWESTIVA